MNHRNNTTVLLVMTIVGACVGYYAYKYAWAKIKADPMLLEGMRLTLVMSGGIVFGVVMDVMGVILFLRLFQRRDMD